MSTVMSNKEYRNNLYFKIIIPRKFLVFRCLKINEEELKVCNHDYSKTFCECMVAKPAGRLQFL